jgi:ketosteroid isomerase-like protein
MTAKMPEDPATRTTLEAVRRFNEAFDRHDVDGVMAAMTEDCVFELHGRGYLHLGRPLCRPLAV